MRIMIHVGMRRIRSCLPGFIDGTDSVRTETDGNLAVRRTPRCNGRKHVTLPHGVGRAQYRDGAPASPRPVDFPAGGSVGPGYLDYIGVVRADEVG